MTLRRLQLMEGTSAPYESGQPGGPILGYQSRWWKK